MPEPIGSIIAYGGEITSRWEADNDWLLCDGRELGIAAFPALHNAILFAWGGDNTRGKFRLPNLMGYFLRGVDITSDGDPLDKDIELRVAMYPGGNKAVRSALFRLMRQRARR